MKIIRNSLFVSVLIWSTVVFCAGKKESLGIISLVEGSVTLERGGKNLEVRGLEGLIEGDVLKVAKDGKISIALCEKATKFDAVGLSEFSVEKKGLQFTKGKLKSKKIISKKLCFLLSNASIDAESRVNLTGSEKNSEKNIYILRGGEVEKGEFSGMIDLKNIECHCIAGKEPSSAKFIPVIGAPFFTLNNNANASRNSISIYEDCGRDKSLFQAEFYNNSYKYPASAPKLESNICYSAKIQSYGASKEIIEERSIGFFVLDNSVISSFTSNEKKFYDYIESEPENPTTYVLLGNYYEANGLILNAMENYFKGLSLDTENTPLRERLSKIALK